LHDDGIYVLFSFYFVLTVRSTSPYKFQTPWDAFEFGYHIIHSEANLVIISMAWLTQEGAASFSQMPQEPDMETLMYWATRLEPVIRAEEEDEIIIVFCNRCGTEDEAVYAGTSAVLGVKEGEVSVYGILGRGDKDLLVVDTEEAPFAKMVLCPADDEVPAETATASSQGAVTSPTATRSNSLPNSASRTDSFPTSIGRTDSIPVSATRSDSFPFSSGRTDSFPVSVARTDSFPVSVGRTDSFPASLGRTDSFPISESANSTLEEEPESFYTSYENKSSSGSGSGKSSGRSSGKSYGDNISQTKKSTKSAPPRLDLPKSSRVNSIKRKGNERIIEDHLMADIPTPSAPSPTPQNNRPKLGLPISQWAASQAQHIATSPQSTMSVRSPQRSADIHSATSPSDKPSPKVVEPFVNAYAKRHYPAIPDVEELYEPTRHRSRHRRTKSRGSEFSQHSKSAPQQSPVHYNGNEEHHPISPSSDVSFSPSGRGRTPPPRADSPTIKDMDSDHMSYWFERLPATEDENAYKGEPSPRTTDYMVRSPHTNVDSLAKTRLSVIGNDPIFIAASPSVLQTTFSDPFGNLPRDVDDRIAEEPATIFGMISPRSIPGQSPRVDIFRAQPSPVSNGIGEAMTTEDADSLPLEIEAYHASDSRPVSAILSPIQTENFPFKTQEQHKTDDTLNGSGQTSDMSNETLDADGDDAINLGLSQETTSSLNGQQKPLVLSGDYSTPSEADGLVSPRLTIERKNKPNLRSVVNGTELYLKTDNPAPSPASFTSSVETISPGNEVPPTPHELTSLGLQYAAPSPALPEIHEEDDGGDTPPVSPAGKVQFRGTVWMDKMPPVDVDRPKSMVW
jgi:hypothetical protein